MNTMRLCLAVVALAIPPLSLADDHGDASGAHLRSLGDFDGDGRDDVLLRHTDGRWRYYQMDGADVLPGSGDAGLTRDLAWRPAGLGDFDGDGKDDVLLRHADGRWYYYPMDGRAVLDGHGAARLTRDLAWRVAGIGDFDGDGKDDVLLRKTDGRWYFYPMAGRTVRDGRGTVPMTRDLAWRMAGIGDFDGDGKDDVLLRKTDGRWYFYPMDGRRRAEGRGTVRMAWDLAWQMAGVGDFDADGRHDVLLRHEDGRWQHYPLDGRRVLAGAGLVDLASDTSATVAGIGDLNGDGSADVLARLAGGGWRYYALDGRQVLSASGVAALSGDRAWGALPRAATYEPPPPEASFTYEETGVPFQVRFDASQSVGNDLTYEWNFGDLLWRSYLNNGVTDAMLTSDAVAPTFTYLYLGDFRKPGEYPYTATYEVTLTVTDRDGVSDSVTEEVQVTNTLASAGQRDLVNRITEDGGHRGMVAVLEAFTTEPYKPHAVRMRLHTMEEGVPEERVVIPLIEESVIANNGESWTRAFLAQRNHAALRRETLVVNQSVSPAFERHDAEVIDEQNMLWVASAGNNDEDRACFMRDRWNPTSWRRCGFSLGQYHGMMDVLRTGKALVATAAIRLPDGTVAPDMLVMPCGDTSEHCFAVTHATSASEATARLSSIAYHLFQTYEDAEDVVHALKRCAEDAGEHGVDREFGQGVVDLRCAEAMLPIVDR